MKKITKMVAISGLIVLSTAYAGAMGPVSAEVVKGSHAFVSLDGVYTWNQIDGISLNGYSPVQSKQNWGGRFAAGRIYPFSEKLSFSGELGGGYYGTDTINILDAGWSGSFLIDGYDALVGAIYNFNQFDIFGNIGIMAQNLRGNIIQDLATLIPGGVNTGTTHTKWNSTQILPEVKVGVIYNLNSKWAVSLSYMHVFGSNLQGSVFYTETTTNATQDVNQNTQNPTLNSILFGVRCSI